MLVNRQTRTELQGFITGNPDEFIVEHYKLTCKTCGFSYVAFYYERAVLDNILKEHEDHDFNIEGLNRNG